MLTKKLNYDLVGSFFQFFKFVLVGFLNTLIDFAILNILIFASGAASGLVFVFFKAIGFAGANTNSYLWNKFWTFKTKTLLAEPKDKVMEFSKFFFVSLVGLIINVSAASLIVNLVKPQFGLNPILWANLANALAVVVSLIWNFLGYKLFVFTGQSKNLVV